MKNKNIFGIIYKVSNTINDKIYIGQTTRTLEKRMQRHRDALLRGEKFHFYNALRKYGMENFKWEIIYKAKTLEELNSKEQEYILLYDSYKNGYNMQLGGSKGKQSQLIKDKISKANTGKKRTKEEKIKMSNSQKGKKIPIEQINKIIATRRKNGWYKKDIEEVKKNMRHEHKKPDNKRILSDVHKSKIGAGNKGKKRTEIQNKNTGIRMKEWWANKKLDEIKKASA
jgi:group I intron endonuclease